MFLKSRKRKHGFTPLEISKSQGIVYGNAFSAAGKKKRFLSLTGFTLIEIIVSATIFSFICVGVGTVFFSGMKLWKRAEQRSIYQEGIMIDLEAFARQLRQTFRLKQAGFSGSENTVSFVSLDGGKIIKYIYEYDSLHKILLQKKQVFKDILEEKEIADVKEFITKIDDLKIKYLGMDEKKNKTEWSNSWDGKKGYPLAVNLEGQKGKIKFQKTVFIPITSIH